MYFLMITLFIIYVILDYAYLDFAKAFDKVPHLKVLALEEIT